MLNDDRKAIPNFELYSISRDGVVNNGRKDLKPYLNNSGYLCIDLKQGVRTKHLIHRLVAQTYIDNPNNYPIVNHIDGNKLNNHVDNLEWCTNSHNILHARASGLNPYNNPTKGLKIGKGSKYHNVTYDRARNKWKGSIRHEGKNLGQKRFNTEEEAGLYVNELIDRYGLDRPKNII